jgi:hypothetical protein
MMPQFLLSQEGICGTYKVGGWMKSGFGLDTVLDEKITVPA